MTDRLRAVGEEMLLTLTRPEDEGTAPAGRHLLLVARNDGDAVELEFAATTDDSNLEDQLALLGEQTTGPRWRLRSRSDCCATMRRRCATSSFTTRT